MGNSWHSWIPTNLGELNFNYFGKSKSLDFRYKSIQKTNNSLKIEKLDISIISDTYTPISKYLEPTFLLPSLEEEVYGYIDCVLYVDNSVFKGKLTLFYPEIFLVEVQIEIKENGEFKVFDFKLDNEDKEIWSDFRDYDDFESYLAQIIFILTKSIVHGDNHHHQKIDTAITINKNSFDAELILENLIKHVKSVEIDIKNIDKCYGQLKAENSLEEMKGYRSYINTFRTLFLLENKSNKTYVKEKSILNNIIDSIESSVKKLKNKINKFSSIMATSLIYIAAIISGGILYINLMGDNYYSTIETFDYYLVYLGILTLVLIAHLKCSISSYIFYNFYHLFEYLFHLVALKKPKGMTNKIMKFFWVNKYGLFALTIFILLMIGNNE